MRIDRKLGLCVMICTGILTGCYPGNKPQTNENSAHSVDMEIQNEKLHSDITEQELQSANVSSAMTGCIGTLQVWNPDAVKEVFHVKDSDIVSQKSTVYTDTDTGYYYELKDQVNLGYSNGLIHYTTNLGNLVELYFNDESAYVSPTVYQKTFPDCTYSDFSAEDALSVAQDCLRQLEITVSDDPAIFAVDTAHLNQIRDKMIQAQGSEEDCPEIPTDFEAYHICYQLQAAGKNLMPTTPVSLETNQEPMAAATLSLTITKDGIEQFNCVNALTIEEKDAEDVSICSAEEAYAEIKNNLDKTVLANETYLENIYFAYGMGVIDDNTFKLLPLYHIGSYEVVNDENYLQPHFVNAQTGKER